MVGQRVFIRWLRIFVRLCSSCLDGDHIRGKKTRGQIGIVGRVYSVIHSCGNIVLLIGHHGLNFLSRTTNDIGLWFDDRAMLLDLCAI